MTEQDDFDQDAGAGAFDEPSAIGVGMGGSCPVCRAPVDLGQEFCLECGSPIRFTPKTRKPQRGATRAGATPAARPAPSKGGFPWVPFLIVLALIGGGVALAMVDDGGSSKSSSSKDSTEPALPEITNEVPETTTDDGSTVTVDDCGSTPLDQTQPALADGTTDPNAAPTSTDPVTGEQIPQLDSTGGSLDGTDTSSFEDPTGGVPSTDPGSSSGVVTVDRNGDLCDGSSGGSTTPTDPSATPDSGTSTTPTTNTTSTSTTDTGTTNASGDWPSGTDGWTVIVAGYDTEARATQRAADLQKDGFSDGGVLFSTDFQSLCPGLYVVFSGTFETESKAKSRKAQLESKGNYAGTYVREIKTTGSRPSGCATASS